MEKVIEGLNPPETLIGAGVGTWEDTEFITKLSQNPNNYTIHEKLIKELEQMEDTEGIKLRNARDKMRRLFGITKDTWIKWIDDEIIRDGALPMQIDDVKDFDRAVNMFENALRDCNNSSVEIWDRYLTFIQIKCDMRLLKASKALKFDGKTKNDCVRSLFRRAVNNCGANYQHANPKTDNNV